PSAVHLQVVESSVRSAFRLLVAAFVSFGAAAQSQDIADRIVGASVNGRGAISFLETLTDTVGGRVTGSPESRAASELILKTLRDAGFANARIEEFRIAAGWKRGPASASVTSPVKQPLHLGSYGWAPGIQGEALVATATESVD